MENKDNQKKAEELLKTIVQKIESIIKKYGFSAIFYHPHSGISSMYKSYEARLMIQDFITLEMESDRIKKGRQAEMLINNSNHNNTKSKMPSYIR